jgi:hypothetical protein
MENFNTKQFTIAWFRITNGLMIPSMGEHVVANDCIMKWICLLELFAVIFAGEKIYGPPITQLMCIWSQNDNMLFCVKCIARNMNPASINNSRKKETFYHWCSTRFARNFKLMKSTYPSSLVEKVFAEPTPPKYTLFCETY